MFSPSPPDLGEMLFQSLQRKAGRLMLTEAQNWPLVLNARKRSEARELEELRDSISRWTRKCEKCGATLVNSLCLSCSFEKTQKEISEFIKEV
jgi:recombinational DNA repair protein RecR